uniref:Pentraxin family member n=1 Tax=Callorhinchus milii TaxID=7868 RepID=A0A4W3JV58_CALMI
MAQLSFLPHIQSLIRTAFLHLHHTAHLQPYLTAQAAETFTILNVLTEGFAGKSLVFGEEETGQVKLFSLPFFRLTALTLCMSLATELQRASTLFSYSLSDGNRELALLWDADGYFTMYIAGHNQTFHLPGPDALMRRVCLTWESATGASRFWMDGKRSLGKTFGQGASVQPGGLFFLGKEQGAGLEDSEHPLSFIGEIADVNLWEHVLLPQQMRKVSQGCSGLTGNILDWSTVIYEKEGAVKVDITDDCP